MDFKIHERFLINFNSKSVYYGYSGVDRLLLGNGGSGLEITQEKGEAN